MFLLPTRVKTATLSNINDAVLVEEVRNKRVYLCPTMGVLRPICRSHDEL